MRPETFKLKLGLMNYSPEEIEVITIVCKKIASIMDKLNESDARTLAAFIDPTLDRYVLGGWDKRDIIQEAIEDSVKENTDKSYWMDNMYDIAEAISYSK